MEAGRSFTFDPGRAIKLQAVRCLQCGDTRWSLFPGSLERALAEPCELCGGETVPERRRPGSGPRTLAVERRRAMMPQSSLTTAPQSSLTPPSGLVT
jgi:hypothetical protein